MKLGAAYNLFDGEELLEQSILSIRKSVDFISVVYQTVSNHGIKADENLENLLINLKDKKLIDLLYLYTPNLKKSAAWNELKKRNIGLKQKKKQKCTHFISMDSDEFYIAADFDKAKNEIESNNYDSSACQMLTFFKEPIYRVEPKEEYFVPFIYRIRWFTKLNRKVDFPVLADRTRIMKPGRFKLFDRSELEMYHYSYVRKSIVSKISNSSAKVNFHDNTGFLSYFNNWTENEPVYFANNYNNANDPTVRSVVKIDNIFNICI